MAKKTTAEFIDICSLKHNNKYDYSLVEYNGVGNKVRGSTFAKFEWL